MTPTGRTARGSAEAEERLARAMALFWRRGFHDTSVADLVAETGANRYGLYGEYGSKQAYFRAALALYQREVTAAMTAMLAHPDAGLDEVRSFFRQFLDVLATPAGSLGCLMCNTATEIVEGDEEVARDVDDFLSRQRGLFRAAFANARSRGDVAEDAEPEILADYCVGSLMGLMAYARSPAPRNAVRNHIQGILGCLDAMARSTGQNSIENEPREEN